MRVSHSCENRPMSPRARQTIPATLWVLRKGRRENIGEWEKPGEEEKGGEGRKEKKAEERREKRGEGEERAEEGGEAGREGERGV